MLCFELRFLNIKELDPFWHIIDTAVIGCKDINIQAVLWVSLLQRCLDFDLAFSTRRTIENLIDCYQIQL